MKSEYYNILYKQGWNVYGESGNNIEIGFETVHGETFSFMADNRDLYLSVYNFWFDFEIDDYVETWLRVKKVGFAGVPSARILVEDAEEIVEMLEKLFIALKDA